MPDLAVAANPGSRLIVMRKGFPLSKLLLDLLVDPIYLFCSRLTSFHHVAVTLAFMLAHGVSVSVAFALRRERNPDRIRALLEISGNSCGAVYLTLLILLVSGIIAGFLGHRWRSGWIWAS